MATGKGNGILNEILTQSAANLDIPIYVYEDAVLKYEDVGAWLAADTSDLNAYSPEIFPQGSFRLGTVVRPISDVDEYDIDLVCLLVLEKERTTQENLKKLVGDRLKLRDDLSQILETLRRCWRLNFHPNNSLPHFHMDILPAIPNRDNPITGILITDSELRRWQTSDPKAYADWFYDRMKTVFMERKSFVAKSLDANVEEVPDWQVKTPLQIAIQLIKRHRDFHFQNDIENKPISIIITTLATLVYNNQNSVYEALVDIVKDLPKNIENRNGKWWVENPVDANENFADKWNEYPERYTAFESWLQKIQADIAGLDQSWNFKESEDYLKPIFGQQFMSSVISGIQDKEVAVDPVSRRKEISVPGLDDSSHCLIPPWPMQVNYKTKIIGSVHHPKSSKKLWDLTGRPVPKNLKLKFKIITNTPEPYTVKWQVVNTGKEAFDAGDLRGDFLESAITNPNNHWETTSYIGTHWVEAFLLKDGICVAKSGKKIVRVR